MRLTYVYILLCKNNTFYTGVAYDVEHRLRLHVAGIGAKYTRAFGVRCLVFKLPTATRGTALRLEYRIKQLSRKDKQLLIRNYALSLQLNRGKVIKVL